MSAKAIIGGILLVVAIAVQFVAPAIAGAIFAGEATAPLRRLAGSFIGA